MDIEYVVILTWKNLTLIEVANIWTSFVCQFVKGLMGGIIILASYGHPFSRVYENLPQLPSHNISIIAKID